MWNTAHVPSFLHGEERSHVYCGFDSKAAKARSKGQPAFYCQGPTGALNSLGAGRIEPRSRAPAAGVMGAEECGNTAHVPSFLHGEERSHVYVDLAPKRQKPEARGSPLFYCQGPTGALNPLGG
ncbi:MAG: hypothetical protein LBP88_09065, partial [Treponema sp.]|nr:hypothetical protein [Treponema sp.]